MKIYKVRESVNDLKNCFSIAPPWCNLMRHRKQDVMRTKGKGEKKHKMKAIAKSSRASVSFPVELYHSLEHLAKEKKVSVAWIVREAAEKYVADRHPLFSKSN